MAGAKAIGVAVVEDEQDIRELVGDVLRDAGFIVTLASDVQELQPSWRGEVILLDSGRAVYHVEEIARRVALLRERSGASVVIMSAHSETLRDVPRLGADAALRKPFELDELLSVVREVVHSREP